MTGRRWRTPDGRVLAEGEPSPVDFEGVPLPGVAEAHAYRLLDGSGAVLQAFGPGQVRLDEYKECFHLIRYQVIEGELVRFTSYCHEESTYDTPFAKEPERTVILSGLKPL